MGNNPGHIYLWGMLSIAQNYVFTIESTFAFWGKRALELVALLTALELVEISKF